LYKFLNQGKMENQNKSNQDCGCSDDSCCVPTKKSSPWQKWIFIAIIVAAAAIVTVKLINKDDSAQEQCCDKPETCCPQSNSDSNE
jgi:hypothetical protein